MARSRTYCYHANTTIAFLCIAVELFSWQHHKGFSVAMQMQELFPSALLIGFIIFITAVHNTKVARSACKVSCAFVWFYTNLEFLDRFSSPLNQISSIYVQWEPFCYMRQDRYRKASRSFSLSIRTCQEMSAFGLKLEISAENPEP
jgi:hypothetical protein